MSVFVHAQGTKTVHAGGGVRKWQNSVHVVVECPLYKSPLESKSVLCSALVTYLPKMTIIAMTEYKAASKRSITQV